MMYALTERYRQTSNIGRTLIGNKNVDHSAQAPSTSSFSI